MHVNVSVVDERVLVKKKRQVPYKVEGRFVRSFQLDFNRMIWKIDISGGIKDSKCEYRNHDTSHVSIFGM